MNVSVSNNENESYRMITISDIYHKYSQFFFKFSFLLKLLENIFRKISFLFEIDFYECYFIGRLSRTVNVQRVCFSEKLSNQFRFQIWLMLQQKVQQVLIHQN
jgi:hypothetical protein